MLHVHVDDFRPDRIYRTGVIEPYPIRQWSPVDIAGRILTPFISAIRPTGPAAKPEPQPEEIVGIAQTMATAMQQGIRMPRGVDAKLLTAAKSIIEGKPFVVTASGRTVAVQPSGGRVAAIKRVQTRPKKVATAGPRMMLQPTMRPSPRAMHAGPTAAPTPVNTMPTIAAQKIYGGRQPSWHDHTSRGPAYHSATIPGMRQALERNPYAGIR